MGIAELVAAIKALAAAVKARDYITALQELSKLLVIAAEVMKSLTGPSVWGQVPEIDTAFAELEAAAVSEGVETPLWVIEIIKLVAIILSNLKN